MIRSLNSFLILALLVLLASFQSNYPGKATRYLPLGDSYTICTGASEKESWPYLLTEHLNNLKLGCSLLDNPARNGFSTRDLIENELPLVKKLKPDLVTLLIGVNDWVRQVPKEDFVKNLKDILDELQRSLPDKHRIILITIPDFGVTPQGKHYSRGRDISKGIAEFNAVILQEAVVRHLPVVDIFELSKKMESDNSLVAADGLHPSAKEYAAWENLILPEAVKLLK